MCPLQMRFGETGYAESSTVSKCAVDFLKAEPMLIHCQQQSIGILRPLYPGLGAGFPVSSLGLLTFGSGRSVCIAFRNMSGMEERSPC